MINAGTTPGSDAPSQVKPKNLVDVIQPSTEEKRPAAGGGPAFRGADLAAWRARLGLTQQAAADRLGVRQSTVSKAEARTDAPLGSVLRQALATVLSAERRSA